MGFTTTATLQLKNNDDFRRVLEFVKPNESDTPPQTDEEFGQVINYVDNLSGPLRKSNLMRNIDWGMEMNNV